MRKVVKIQLALIVEFIMMLMLSSCSQKNEIDNNQLAINGSTSETEMFSFLEGEVTVSDEIGNGEKDPTKAKALAWNDNKMDAYHAVINHVVQKIEIEGENPLNSVPFIGEGGCARYGKHYFSDYRKSWDGINGISMKGEEFGTKVEVDLNRVGPQIQALGTLSGKDGYLACFGEYIEGKYSNDTFYELDQDFQVIRTVSTQLHEHGSTNEIMGDVRGSFHVIYYAGGNKDDYVIVSPDGEILFEKEVENASLCAFGDGRVALCEKALVGNVWRFSEYNLETGKIEELIFSKEEAYRNTLNQLSAVFSVTPVDEYQALLCVAEEICLYDVRTKKTETLYKWSNHGILPQEIIHVTKTLDGSIGILYRDGSSRDYIYLLLMPTDEKEELQMITIATTPYNSKYEKMAALFQKQYPQYVIQVKKDYDETSLLTQLAAGDGPVIIDTSLTGFEDLEKLWQPLDGFFDQTGLVDELIPKALEFGRIGDIPYGIVQQFRIDTLLVTESGPTDWNYDEFLNAVENFSGAAYADVIAEGKWSDQRERFLGIFNNGLEDNYFLDAKTGKTIFGTQAFEKLLKLSQKAANCPPTESWGAILDGEAMCEHEYVFNVQQAILLRRALKTKGVRNIGYPTKKGGRARIVADAPLAIRRTATEEEKKIAYTFLKVCLSKEAINSLGRYNFAVRKDVIEDAFQEYQEQVEELKLLDAYSAYDPEKWPELDWEADTKFLYDMIDNGVVKKKFPEGLQKVFDEELGEYIDGRINENAIDSHLKNRVWLYLEELK